MHIFATVHSMAISHQSSENKSQLIQKNYRLHLLLSTIELHCLVTDLSDHLPQTQINAWAFLLFLFVEKSLTKPAMGKFPLKFNSKARQLVNAFQLLWVIPLSAFQQTKRTHSLTKTILHVENTVYGYKVKIFKYL